MYLFLVDLTTVTVVVVTTVIVTVTVLVGLPKKSIRQLQLIRNTAA